MPRPSPNKEIFINCPFDLRYRPMFEAIVFAVADCGFSPRCALELTDGSQVRIQKILQIIGECRFGIHDISHTELDGKHRLPRFNMPFELGLFLGAKRYGGRLNEKKCCLILDRAPYRYQQFLSDIAGQDIDSHAGKPLQAITMVRNWLQAASRPVSWTIPSGKVIGERYRRFRRQVPGLCRRLGLAVDELTFLDYLWLISSWLAGTSHRKTPQ